MNKTPIGSLKIKLPGSDGLMSFSLNDGRKCHHLQERNQRISI